MDCFGVVAVRVGIEKVGCGTLIRIWVDKYEAGAFDEDTAAASMIQDDEARVAALERLVGRQVLEFEFLEGARRQGRRSRNAPMSVITGPKASPSPKNAD